MSTSLLVSSTSFLPPKNKAWKHLAPFGETAFAEYGDWSGTLLNGDAGQAVLLVLFLGDLVGADDGAAAPTEMLLGLLRQRLQRATAPTIVAFSSWHPDSVIRQARQRSRTALVDAQLRQALDELNDAAPQLYSLDLDRALAVEGYARSFDARNWYVAHCRLSALGIDTLARAAAAILARSRQAPSKVLVLDCDNTLWGGVVGEDGVEGLVIGQDGLGSAFADFQRGAARLARDGVLLALCSKNNEADVWAAFDRHQAMQLQRGDIVAYRINWEDKSANLVALAQELDLGLDSFVFWDDNPMERERVRSQLPQVLTVEAPEDVTQWPALLASLDCFASLRLTADDRKRNEQYKSRARFVQESAAVIDESAYLRSIALQPRALPLDQGGMARAVQLCLKTNQYNLRTRRHDEAALRALQAASADSCFLASLQDRYGDHGVVGLVCTRALDARHAFLDTFLMSCRVLGRHLEAWMLYQAVQRLQAAGHAYLFAEYIPTARNNIAAGFLSGHGFAAVDAATLDAPLRAALGGITDGGVLYRAALADIRIPFLEVYPT